MAAPDLPTHESPIKTPKQLVIVVVLSFAIPVIVIAMLAKLVTTGISVDPDSAAQSSDVVAARIKPVAEVVIGEASKAEKGRRTGEQIYQSTCAACHDTGAAGAPKTGDKAAWAKRIAEGQKQMVVDAIKGVRAMPPRGGDPSLSDTEVERAVVFMINRSGGNFKEPPPEPAAARGADKAAAK
jgi:cytochrome c5